VIGTPSYMAPEQHLGQAVGPAADQFAFCVSLYEALYRMRPFRGRAAVEVARSIVDGTIQPVPEGSHVPAWLHKTILRGLSPAPEGRWASMNELLAALGRDPAAHRRRASLGAGLLVVAAGAGLLARGATPRPSFAAAPPTRSPPRGATRRASAPAPASSPAVPPARSTPGSASPAASTSTPGAGPRRTRGAAPRRASGGWPRRWCSICAWPCLERRRDELAALVALYERPDGAMVSQAPLAVHQLAPSEPCAEVSVLTAHLEPPAGATAERVAEVRRQLARADALFVAGRYRDARAVVGAAVAAAGAVGFAPLQAEALFLDGVVAGFAGDPPAASSSLIAALRVAKASGHAAAEADAWTELVWVTGKDLAHYDEALRVAEIARGASVASPDEAREALLDSNVAEVLVAQGRQAPALELHQRALARREKLFGSSHPDVGKSLTNLGNLHYQAGRLDEAVASFRGAAEVFTRALGPNHVLTGRARGNLGEALRAAGRLEEAAVELGGAREALIAALGPDALQVAFVETNLGILHTQRRAFDEGRASFARARGIFEARRGAEHPDVAYVLEGMGDLECDAGEPARALPLLEQALAIRRAAQVDPVRIAETQVAIARGAGGPRPTRDVARARALLAAARPVLIAAGEGGKDVLVLADAIKL
jgi:tetratricopeptide (TPR) repeat protein